MKRNIIFAFLLFAMLLMAASTLAPPVYIPPLYDDSAAGELRLMELRANGSNYVGLLAPQSIASDFSLTLPSALGSADDVISTDASGNLSFGKVAPANLSTSVREYTVTTTLFDPDGLQATYDIDSFYINRSGTRTIQEVTCEIDGGSATINLQRDDGTPANILATDLACSTSGASTTGFNAGENTISTGHKVDLDIISTSTATRLSIAMKMRVD